ncbi:MAG TPA: conjugal transfer protein, partial [Conexibacter sp.]|nr:conjugal transfer protein [Conexibacter sp.]
FASPRPAAQRGPAPARLAPFPDSEARAFAVSYARAYLAPGDRRTSRQAVLARFSSQSLSDQAVLEPPRSPGAAVAEATVAREVSLGDSRAILTVATFTGDGRRRYLAVPVARDERGGLVVYDLPALVAPPPLGAAEAPAATPLSGPDGEAVEALTRRFLRAYFQESDLGALSYLIAPGAHVVPHTAGLWLEEVEEVGRLGGSPTRGLLLAATVRVRDLSARATYRLRYRISVVRTDRWYVTSVAGGPRS